MIFQHIKSKADYDSLTTFLSEPVKGKDMKRFQTDYYAMKNVVTMHASLGEKDYLSFLKVFQEAADEDGDVNIFKIIKLVVKEDLHEIIRYHHLLRQHAGARNTSVSIEWCCLNI